MGRDRGRDVDSRPSGRTSTDGSCRRRGGAPGRGASMSSGPASTCSGASTARCRSSGNRCRSRSARVTSSASISPPGSTVYVEAVQRSDVPETEHGRTALDGSSARRGARMARTVRRTTGRSSSISHGPSSRWSCSTERRMVRVSRWNSATIDQHFLTYNFRPKTEWPRPEGRLDPVARARLAELGRQFSAAAEIDLRSRRCRATRTCGFTSTPRSWRLTRRP